MTFSLDNISNLKYSQVVPVDLLHIAFHEGQVDSLRYLSTYLRLRACFSKNAGNIPKQYDENQLVSVVSGYSKKTASRHIKKLLSLGWLRRLKSGGLQLVSASRIISNHAQFNRVDATFIDTDVLFGYSARKTINFKQWALSVLEERFLKITFPDKVYDSETKSYKKVEYPSQIYTLVKKALNRKDVKYNKKKDEYRLVKPKVKVSKKDSKKSNSPQKNKKLKKIENYSFSAKTWEEKKSTYKPCCTAIGSHMTDKSRQTVSRYHLEALKENKNAYKSQCVSKLFLDLGSMDLRYLNEYFIETLGEELKHGKFIIKRGKVTYCDITRRLVGLVPITRKKLYKFKSTTKTDCTISKDDIRNNDSGLFDLDGKVYKIINRQKLPKLTDSVFGQISTEITF